VTHTDDAVLPETEALQDDPITTDDVATAKMMVTGGGEASTSTANLNRCEGLADKSDSGHVFPDSDSAVLEDALKKLDEYRGVLEICHKKYPDFLAMERKILALEEENRSKHTFLLIIQLFLECAELTRIVRVVFCRTQIRKQRAD